MREIFFQPDRNIFQVIMSNKEAAERACKEPNPIIDGRKANVNLAILGAKPRGNLTGLIIIKRWWWCDDNLDDDDDGIYSLVISSMFNEKQQNRQTWICCLDFVFLHHYPQMSIAWVCIHEKSFAHLWILQRFFTREYILQWSMGGGCGSFLTKGNLSSGMILDKGGHFPAD